MGRALRFIMWWCIHRKTVKDGEETLIHVDGCCVRENLYKNNEHAPGILIYLKPPVNFAIELLILLLWS